MIQKTHTWLTREVVKHTKDALTITFNTNGKAFHYEPGQFVNVSLVINGIRITRSYSLSSSPDVDTTPSITVKRVAGGLMSNYIADHTEEIDEWEIEGPYGIFTPGENSYKSNHIVLMAGGSGITPIWSIARSILKRTSATLTLIYANRSWGDMIFADELTGLVQKYGDRINVFHALSKPSAEERVPADHLINGRLSKLVIRKLVKNAVPEKYADVHYFLCGPSGLMSLYQEALEALTVPLSNIFKERFTTDEDGMPEQAVELPDSTHDVLFHFYEQTHLVKVLPGKNILTAVLDHGVPIRHSCKSGTCGSCVAILTDGKINMIKNFALTESEVKQGIVLLCQSYPLSDDVILEID